MGTMEDLIRRIVREEIARALSAVESVAEDVYAGVPEDSSEERAAYVLMRTMERVARDVLANTHPVLTTEHASTQVVHVVTTAAERASTPSTDECSWCGHASHDEHIGLSCDCGCSGASTRVACTCHRHVHVMGLGVCGALGCYCRATFPSTPSTPSTKPSTCTYCYHLHTGPGGDCVAPVGKYTCPCPFAGGRP